MTEPVDNPRAATPEGKMSMLARAASRQPGAANGALHDGISNG